MPHLDLYSTNDFLKSAFIEEQRNRAGYPVGRKHVGTLMKRMGVGQEIDLFNSSSIFNRRDHLAGRRQNRGCCHGQSDMPAELPPPKKLPSLTVVDREILDE